VKANVCPHCGVDFPKRTFNLMLVAVPVGLAVIVFAVVQLLPGGSVAIDPNAPPPLAAEPPEVAPPEIEVVLDDTVMQAPPIVAETPPTISRGIDRAVSATTRWTSTWVNVRRDPSARAPVEQQLNPGVRVEVGRYQFGFWEVFLDGVRLGYVANSLLLREPPES
jgi:hypothetical protein